MQKTKEFSVLSFNLLKKILANKASAFFFKFLMASIGEDLLRCFKSKTYALKLFHLSVSFPLTNADIMNLTFDLIL